MPLIKKEKAVPLRGVQAKKRKRQRRRIFYLALSGLLVSVAAVLTITLFFNVEHIEVKGDSIYSKEEIIDATGIAFRSNMFKIDKFKVIAETERILPYVQNVSIKRKLPTTMEITVEAAQNASYVTTAGGFTILSEQDKVLANVPEKPAVPELIGSGIVANNIGETAAFSSDFTKEMYDKLFLELKNAELLPRLSKIDITKSYNMSVEIEGKALVLIGPSEELPRKISFLKFILSKEDISRSFSIIDISNTESSRASVKTVTEEEYNAQLEKQKSTT
ncbi:MAG: FtsQ-type POTRA domain-containing protein [Clostridia bacterium]